MEDSWQSVQDLTLDDNVSCTYYAVFDGHGGAECANFCRENLHIVLKQCFLDQIEGVKDADDLNDSLINCIEKAFEITD